MLEVPVDQTVHAAHGAQDAVKFAARHTIFHNVDGLEFDSAFFEVPLGLFRIKALACSENLNVHLIPPALLWLLLHCLRKTGILLSRRKPPHGP